MGWHQKARSLLNSPGSAQRLSFDREKETTRKSLPTLLLLSQNFTNWPAHVFFPHNKNPEKFMTCCHIEGLRLLLHAAHSETAWKWCLNSILMLDKYCKKLASIAVSSVISTSWETFHYGQIRRKQTWARALLISFPLHVFHVCQQLPI